MLLLAGGDTDPQIITLLKHAAMHGVNTHCLFTGQSGTPCLNWNIQSNTLHDGEKEIRVQAAFIRQDVFAYLQSKNQQDQSIGWEWYTTISGWLKSSPEIRILNHDFLGHGAVNKPYILRLALEIGFNVADTYISNDLSFMNDLAATASCIQKPVTGGGHCTVLKSQTISSTPKLTYPVIIQQRLTPPELRVFRIGDECFGFNVISDELDYRTSHQTKIEVARVPEDIQEKMIKLSDQIGLTFAAADFKTDSNDHSLQFLEINTNPMFAGFDQVSNGKLSEAILKYLNVLR